MENKQVMIIKWTKRAALPLACIIVVDILLSILLPVDLLNIDRNEDPSRSVELIAVLFHDFNSTGTGISDETKRRIHHGMSLMNNGTGKYLVVAGGNRPDNTYFGADLMAAYIRDTANIEPGRILIEDGSMDSVTNLQNIGKIMEELHLKTVGLVSSPLHLLRIQMIHQELKGKYLYFPYDAASCSPSLSKWEIWRTVHHNLATFVLWLVLPGNWYNGLVEWIRMHTHL